MSRSLTLTYVFIITLAIFQPVLLKSVNSRDGRGSLSLARIMRDVTDGALTFPKEKPSECHDEETLLRGGVNTGTSPAPCPDNLPYCESADDYPMEKINKIIKKQPKLIMDHFYVEEDEYDINRFSPGENPNESPLCTAKNTIVYPKKAKSKEGLYEFVVNDEVHRQGVRVETCVSNNGECNIPGTLSLGYTSRCAQKHILRTLVVLNSNSSEVEGFVTKPFEFPSCCACFVSMTGDRFGGGTATTSSNTTIAKLAARPKSPKS